MLYRTGLRQLGLLLFFSTACILFGCVPSDGVLSTGKGQSRAHHKPSHTSIVRADNVASADYFQNTEAPNSPDDSSNLWSSIRSDFKLNHYDQSPQVQAQIKWYMTHQGYLDRTTRRAAPFMFYIYQSVKARHLPAELVLLPIIESAYNPFVSSPAGAAGLWQIEPGTGRSFGLRQDFWFDGRRDITTSTNAALDYLTYLHNLFGGDWLLSLAAYDSGEGSVEAAMRRNARQGATTTFWALGLPRETQAYVPRLLALAVIISNPDKYQIELPPISNSAYLGQVDIGPKISLEEAAQLSGISLNELKILNPGYRRNGPDATHPYHLLLPIDRIPVFKKNLLDRTENNTSTAPNDLWNRYKVQARDTWRKIAKRFNTPIDLLKSVNHLENESKPPVGEVIWIPETKGNRAALADATAQEAQDTADNDNEDQQMTAAPEAPKENKENIAPSKNQGLHLYRITHTVKHGETLSSIAKSNGLAEEEIAKWNHLSSHSTLKSGQKLILWKRASEEEHHHKSVAHHIHHHKR